MSARSSMKACALSSIRRRRTRSQEWASSGPASCKHPWRALAPRCGLSSPSTLPARRYLTMARHAARIVIAVGGNAAYPPDIKGLAEEQFALMATMCEHLIRVIDGGYKLILTHGNGPVVGNILFRMAKTSNELVPMPMDVCVAHSQGGMGYMLQQSLMNVLQHHDKRMPVSSIITQVEVSPDDPAFAHPTKPVGRFFSRDDADRISRETGWQFVEDSGRGFRRVVPSPEPLRILDIAAIEALLAADVIPIAAGGGGIPVARDG